ncbi:type VI secretion system peptidoglycan-associated domain protein [compost metagenome]
MSITRTALPLILVSTLLTGCAGLQKTDWPKCAAVGGVVGAGLGAIENSTWAGWGVLVGGATAAAYCWVHGDGDEDGDGVPDSRDKCPGTPPNTPVDANGCPPVVEEVVEEVVVVKEETIVVNDLLFEFDSAKLTEADKVKLDTIASRLKNEAPSARLTITGHTDSVGSDAYNQSLSERRAQSVTDYLVSSGVSQANIVAVQGAGETQPVADNSTDSGRAQNRRVEILIQR